MIVGHLASGVVLGLLAGVVSLAMGFSPLAALGFYVLGGNLGLALSVGVQLVRPALAGPSRVRALWAASAGRASVSGGPVEP